MSCRSSSHRKHSSVFRSLSFISAASSGWRPDKKTARPSTVGDQPRDSGWCSSMRMRTRWTNSALSAAASVSAAPAAYSCVARKSRSESHAWPHATASSAKRRSTSGAAGPRHDWTTDGPELTTASACARSACDDTNRMASPRAQSPIRPARPAICLNAVGLRKVRAATGAPANHWHEVIRTRRHGRLMPVANVDVQQRTHTVHGRRKPASMSSRAWVDSPAW
eukprot:scaffold12001_cov116-Isochrysis_galbana.AAC.17